MIIQWILAITLLALASFLLGLCVMLFRFYSSHKHRYRLHIALMSIADVLFTCLIIGQLISGMFGFTFPQIVTIVLIYLSLGLKIGGLLRMFKHRFNEEKLRK
jgi:O-antigen ligase